MKIKTFVVYLSALMLLLSSYFTSTEHNARYIKYLIFPLGLFFLLFYKNITIRRFLLYNLLLYTSLIAINFIISIYKGVFHIRFLEESFLLLIPVLTAAALTGGKEVNIRKAIDVFFGMYVTSFVLFFWKELLNVPKLISDFISAFRLSEYPTESWLAFPMGLFTLYYFLEKKKIHFIIAMVFFLLSFKRVALFGLVIVLAFWLLNEKIFKNPFRPKQITKFLLGLNVVFVTGIYLFVSGFFTAMVKKYFNVSINHLTQGRFVVYNDVLHKFSEDLWSGSSLGSIHLYLKSKYNNYEYIHSDILKIVIELGVISFIIWLLFFIMINLKGKKSVYIILFLNILFISDNVFIYFDTLFVFYLILAKYDHNISCKKGID